MMISSQLDLFVEDLKLDDSECNDVCPSYPTETCGAHFKSQLYRTYGKVDQSECRFAKL